MTSATLHSRGVANAKCAKLFGDILDDPSDRPITRSADQLAARVLGRWIHHAFDFLEEQRVQQPRDKVLVEREILSSLFQRLEVYERIVVFAAYHY